MTTLPLFDAAQRRDEAIQKVVDHADALDPHWSERAYASLMLYCFQNKDPFITEEVREWAENMGLVHPPHDGRAWGHVMKRAAKNELIKKIGYGLAKSSNLSPKIQWAAA